MKKWGIIVIATTILYAGISCGNNRDGQGDHLYEIKTSYGKIKINLFDKTKEHNENFEKLTGEGFYDGLLFHRVISDFMIQGGDPDSRNAKAGTRLGGGSSGYTLPAEIHSDYFHRRGAIAAARRGGPSNPEKRSSGSQFYIVQGRIFTAGELDTLESTKNQQLKNEMLRQLLVSEENTLNQLRIDNNEKGFYLKIAQLKERVDSIMEAQNLAFRFSPEQREAYTTIGGYPSLDGDYTVFGEVIEGMEVVDKIASLETDANDRPINDIEMIITKIK